jgi:hypothetical protein
MSSRSIPCWKTPALASNNCAVSVGLVVNVTSPRKLNVGDRVNWHGDATNQGTVKGKSWSVVTIDWDDGDSTSVSHNDMAHVDRILIRPT